MCIDSIYSSTAIDYLTADAATNGTINYPDYNQYAQQLGNNTYNRTKLNLDGIVNTNDFNLYQQNTRRLTLRILR